MVAVAAVGLLMLLPTGAAVSPAASTFAVRSELSLLTGTFFPGSLAAGGGGVVALAWDSGSNLLYAVEGGGVLAAFNVTTGVGVSQTYLGGTPRGLAIDPTLDRIYVADSGHSQLDVVRGSTAHVIARLAVGTDPVGVAFDSARGTVYVANAGSGTVTAVNASRDVVVGSMPAGAGASWLAADTKNGDLFVSDSASCSASATVCNLTVVNPANSTVVTTISVGNNPTHVAYDAKTDQMWVVVGRTHRISVFGGTSDAKITSDDVGFGISGNAAYDLALDVPDDRILVSTQFGLVSVNATNHARVNGSGQQPMVPVELAYATSLHLLLVANGGTINAASPVTFVVNHSFATFDAPGGAMYNSFNRLMYVDDASRAILELRNASTGRLVATIPGVRTGAMTFNPRNGTVFVAEGTSIAVFNGTTNQRVETLSDPNGVAALAYDPRNGQLFDGSSNGTVVVYDVASNSTVATIALRAPNGTSGGGINDVVYDPGSNRVYADASLTYDQYSDAYGNLSAINPATDRITASTPIYTLMGAMAVDPIAGQLFVSINAPAYGASSVDAYNLTTLTFVASVPVNNALSNLAGLAWAPSTGDMYATGYDYPIQDDAVYQVIASNDTLGTTLPVGNGLGQPALDRVTGLLWIPDVNQGTFALVVP